MLGRIICGGVGAEVAAWRAAKRCGMNTGGWMPEGSWTADGPRPDYEAGFGARVTEQETAPGVDGLAEFPAGVLRNVQWADATWFLGDPDRPEGRLIRRCCESAGTRFLAVPLSPRTQDFRYQSVSSAAAWLRNNGVRVLNIAAAHLDTPEAEQAIEEWLEQVFLRCRHELVVRRRRPVSPSASILSPVPPISVGDDGRGGGGGNVRGSTDVSDRITPELLAAFRRDLIEKAFPSSTTTATKARAA